MATDDYNTKLPDDYIKRHKILESDDEYDDILG